MAPKTQYKCSVCTDAEDLDNEIFHCKSCNINVHRSCYGIKSEFDANWQCSPCEKGFQENITCKLCVQTGGTFKQTVCGRWCHVVCALWTEGVVFEDPNAMEPINISNVSDNKRNKTCIYCNESQGFCCLCSNSKCKHRLHITCAQKAHGLKEKMKSDEMKSIKFLAYCPDHKPVVAERKISSRSVRRVSLGTIAKKKEAKKNKENCAKLAAQWILDANGAAETKRNDEPNSIDNGIADEKSPQNNSDESPQAIVVGNEFSVQKSTRKRQFERSVDEKSKRVKENGNELAENVEDMVHSGTSNELSCDESKFCNYACKLNSCSLQLILYDSYMKKESGELSWDSCGGSLNVSLGFVEIQHTCYKDAKIDKVIEQKPK